MFLENGVTLAHLLAIDRWSIFFTAQNDLLEQEHMILPVHVRLGHGEDVVQEQDSKVADMVAFPVLDPTFKILDGGSVLCPPLLLVHLVSDTFRRFETGLEFLEMCIFGILHLLDE